MGFLNAFGRPPKSTHDTLQEQLRRIFGKPIDRHGTEIADPRGEGRAPTGSLPASNNHEDDLALLRIKQHLNDHNALLDAYVPRVSTSPMAEIVRQRRQATRELLRNLFALETIQRGQMVKAQ